MVAPVIKDEGRKTISVARDFSRFPAGRVRTYGSRSAEAFRDDILIPALEDLKEGQGIDLDLNRTAGYGSNFLEEVFGGLRRNGYSEEKIKDSITLIYNNTSIIREINRYIEGEI